MSQSFSTRLRLGLVRTRLRGVANSLRLAAGHAYFLRYATPRKVANYGLVKLARLMHAERVRGMPYRYHIDPINVCNLRCPVCPTGLGILGRPPGKIDLATYSRLLDQIAPYAYVLELFEWGEPFLHPQIFDLIRTAHARRISVRLSTNLNHFNSAMAEQTVNCGLDRMVVSVDGATQETYGRYRVGGKLDRVFENIGLIVAERRRQGRRRPVIAMRMLVHHRNSHELADLRRMAAAVGADAFTTGEFFVDTRDPIQLMEWAPRDRSFTAYDWTDGQPENRWHCADLWEAMHIAWDGGAAPCCWTHRSEHDLDNVLTRPVAEVWNGPAYVSSRRVFARGAARAGPVETVCTRCRGRPEYLRI